MKPPDPENMAEIATLLIRLGYALEDPQDSLRRALKELLMLRQAVEAEDKRRAMEQLKKVTKQ